MQIYLTLAPSACVSHGLKSGLYVYLRDSRLLCLSVPRLGEQILCIFTWFSPPLIVLQIAWRADFMYIYVTLAPFVCLSNRRPLLLVSRTAWRTELMHIYMSLATFACLSNRLERVSLYLLVFQSDGHLSNTTFWELLGPTSNFETNNWTVGFANVVWEYAKKAVSQSVSQSIS